MTIVNFDKKCPVFGCLQAGLLAQQSETSTLTVLLYSIWSETDRLVIGRSELTHDQCKANPISFNVGVRVITNKKTAKNRKFFVNIHFGHK